MSEVLCQLIIHCTKKLFAKLPERNVGSTIGVHPLGSWHANLYHMDRRQCVLFCHDQTRFALFVAGLKKQDFENIDYVFFDLFVNTLLRAGYPIRSVEFAADLMQETDLTIDSNCDRSVLGSMRSIYHQELYMAQMSVNNVMELLPYSTSAKLNDRPTRIKGMCASECLWPHDAMRGLLDSLQRN